ncbi:MAG TPA: TniB family NTP-binding protein [Paraburkholderia sp.]
MSNPLLETVGPYFTRQQLASRLAFDPLAGIDVSSASEEQKDLLLGTIRDVVEPTRPSIRMAFTMQRMLRRGYMRRDPTLGASRANTMKVLGLRRTKNPEKIDFGPVYADALVVKGCTGFGKSTTVQRFCSLLTQKHEHGRSDAAGWVTHVQITYLIVPMSIHKGGLVYAILAALDEVLGTNSRDQYSTKKGYTVEKIAIEVGILLVQHSVGLLIIEELQPSNFGASPYRTEMLAMLLRLLNFGIPIVFVGNPLAFDGIAIHSQDLRRLTSEEPVEFMPYEESDSDWREGLAPAMWGHNVMPVRTPCDAEIKQALHQCSAGIPYFAARAVEGCQRLAMETVGASSVTAAHLGQYRTESTAFAACKDLIEGFKFRDPKKLSRFVDVPWEEYALRWGFTIEDILDLGGGEPSSTLSPVSAADQVVYRSVHERIRAQYKADKTREKKKAQTNSRRKSNNTESDRSSKTREALAKGLEALRREVETAKGKPVKSRKEK